MDLRKTPPFKPLSSSEVHAEGREAETEEITELSERLRQEHRAYSMATCMCLAFPCLKLHRCGIGDMEMLD